MSLNNLYIFLFTFVTGTITVLSGCGQDTNSTNIESPFSSSSLCVQCHTISSTSGVLVVDEWQKSAHYTAKGAGCLDCHVSPHNLAATDCRTCHATAHANNGTSCNICHGGGSKETANCTTCHSIGSFHRTPPLANPDSAGKCLNCHSDGKSFKRYTAIALRHFSNITGNRVRPAQYVTINYKNACTSCHEPHNPLKGQGSEQRKAWASSKHGNVNGVAWTTYDFKNPIYGSYYCQRCHTSTGFIKFTETGNAVPVTTWAASDDKSREVLTCKACHLSSNFKNSVRQIPAFTAPYGIVNSTAMAPMAFPNVGESNLCIPCHTGLENGASVKRTVQNFSNASFKNPHYLAAAAVFYGKGGFQFYTSASQTQYWPQAYTSKYGVVVDGTIIKATAASTSNSTPAIKSGDSMVGDKAPWSHGKLGMNNFQTTTRTDIIAAKGGLVFTGTKGQCITCHLGSVNTHSLNAFRVAEATWKTGDKTANSLGGNGSTIVGNGTFAGCYGCHTTENMEDVAHEERLLVDRTLAFFRWQLLQCGMEYQSTYPYFYVPGTKISITNWSALPVPGNNGAANMGAALNFELLTAEKGVHVHNRTFMKQLIFDSLQHLQAGSVRFSNRYITANSQASVNGLINFSGYSTALAAAPDNIRNPPTIAASAGGVPGQLISITQLKAYITRKNTGTSGAIGSSAAPLFTRP